MNLYKTITTVNAILAGGNTAMVFDCLEIGKGQGFYVEECVGQPIICLIGDKGRIYPVASFGPFTPGHKLSREEIRESIVGRRI